jgi:hypothetical protein
MSMGQRKALAAVPIVVAAALLGACREEERGRIVRFEPGVYRGQPDTPLDEATREALRARALYQATDTLGMNAPGGGRGAPAADVRPPAPTSGGDLRDRAASQR